MHFWSKISTTSLKKRNFDVQFRQIHSETHFWSEIAEISHKKLISSQKFSKNSL